MSRGENIVIAVVSVAVQTCQTPCPCAGRGISVPCPLRHQGGDTNDVGVYANLPPPLCLEAAPSVESLDTSK